MWGISEDLLKSWNIVTPLEDNSNVWNNPQEVVRVLKVITIDVGCNTEEEYFRLLRNDKLIKHYEELTVLETLNRDINRHTPIRTMSISKKPTLDKSCMTDDIYEDFENHISQLTTLFPTVPLTHLSYWYNKCKGDLEWTIEFLLEAKEEVTSLIVDDINSMKVDAEKINQSPETDSDSSNNGSEHKIKKRSKRNQRLSTDNDHLKKFIESKIDISGEHYSEKLLKVKNYKFGKPSRVDAVLSEDKIDMHPILVSHPLQRRN
ncbi:hypothetical protein JTB14_009768 [Gonioctena quinquepunctata]|nr:hypothetical protein JTB14_009768 [Gonioctena quinquepunctata]